VAEYHLDGDRDGFGRRGNATTAYACAPGGGGGGGCGDFAIGGGNATGAVAGAPMLGHFVCNTNDCDDDNPDVFPGRVARVAVLRNT